MSRRRTYGNGFDANTLLLLHFENGLKDSSAYNRMLTNVGATFAEGKYGVCGKFINAYATFADKDWFWNLIATGTYTIECWWIPGEDTTYGHEIISDDLSGDISGFSFGGSINKLSFGNFNNNISVGISTTKIWHHIAVVSLEGIVKIYLDGQMLVSKTFIPKRTSHVLCIGGRQGSQMLSCGNLDELRISNVARYTGNFTPPAKPF